MKQRPRIVAAAPGEPPISALNTTPLIDVLLVLLIMFVVTIPAASHKVGIDLPAGAAPAPPPQVHELALSASGALSWDGAPVAPAALPARLAAMRGREPDAMLRLRADGAARYEAFDRLLATIRRAGVTRLAFVGNEHFARSIG